MRYVTPCENVGLRKVPGADHDKKYDLYVIQPGTAWKLDDAGNEVVQIDTARAKGVTYAWELRWIDGRTVAVFLHRDGTEYAQPVIDDPRARRPAPERKERKPRAPGVAEEAPAALASEPEEPATTPRGRRPSALEDGPQTHRKRGGPRGGLKLEI